MLCKFCTGEHIVKIRIHKTLKGDFQMYKCNDCRHSFVGEKLADFISPIKKSVEQIKVEMTQPTQGNDGKYAEYSTAIHSDLPAIHSEQPTAIQNILKKLEEESKNV